jgi:hypothetical protein
MGVDQVTDLLGDLPSCPFPTGITGKLLSSDHSLTAAICTVPFAGRIPLRWLGSCPLVQLDQAGVWDYRLCRAGLQDSFDGSLRFVQFTFDDGSQGVNGPALLLGNVAELAEGHTGGLIHSRHQRPAAVVILPGELGIAELCDNGGLTGYKKSLILSRG